MDDKTYVKLDVKQIPGLNYYVSKICGSLKKIKFRYCDKFAKKLMIWQAICSYCHSLKSTSLLFWPDLARIHYVKDVLI
jgi:hypothetical protein